MTINELMARYVAELEAGEVPAPLEQRFTLGVVWDDLARLAGEDVPPDVAAFVGRVTGYRRLPDAPKRERQRRATPRAIDYPPLRVVSAQD